MNVQTPKKLNGKHAEASRHGTNEAALDEEEISEIARRGAAQSDEEATSIAMQDTLLTPRFYTTDFNELDALDVTPIREEWDKLIAAMKADPN